MSEDTRTPQQRKLARMAAVRSIQPGNALQGAIAALKSANGDIINSIGDDANRELDTLLSELTAPQVNLLSMVLVSIPARFAK